MVEHEDELKQADLYVSYFGTDKPERWGIRGRPLPDFTNPSLPDDDPIRYRPGVYCISATALVGPYFGRPPWDEEREREYVEILRLVKQREPLRRDEPASVQNWRHASVILADRQYFRLRSYLIKRKPDATIGYSILVFRLSAAELRTALVP